MIASKSFTIHQSVTASIIMFHHHDTYQSFNYHHSHFIHFASCVINDVVISQVQGVCLHSGAPCYYSGPHIGVINDNKIFKTYTPPLSDGELLLGDKAYTDKQLCHQVIAPIKARQHGSLSDAELRYNKIHGWYRASIEHCFGYIKRFRILGMQ
jgi:hypothetical protein